tara:strand:- start:748 stop:972 length:225 start_codon:yes stop_codon:yes gene_type:complete
MLKKIEAFLDEMTELAKTDPERCINIIRGFAGILIMADLMKSTMEVEVETDERIKEDMISKLMHQFRNEDDLPN